MGLSLDFGRKTSRRHKIRSEINVTPFVDVMLVLLVIFMLSSQMLISGIEVELPKTKPSPIHSNNEPIVISITKDGDVYIQEAKIDLTTLGAKLSAILKDSPKETRLFIKGDKNTSYGRIAEVFTAIKLAGYPNVALITEVQQ